LSFAALAASPFHTCGVTDAGVAYCWGYNGSGQLGNGSFKSSSIPVAVSGGFGFSAVAAGSTLGTKIGAFGHTCGLLSSGAAYCWGNNMFGQLGDGSSASSSTPVAVAGGLTFRTLVAGPVHTCGLTSFGAAYCWGGDFGSTPVAVSGDLSFSAIAAGGYYAPSVPDGYRPHTCGLTNAGTAYCWGTNNSGQLGDGSTTSTSTPVAVSGGLTFSAVVPAGGDHTCGLTNLGATYCWGDNYYGELGDGSTTNSSVPVVVSGGLRFSAIAGGGNHTCGRTTNGAFYCWGDNAEGQLGDGSTTSSTVPVRVNGPHGNAP